MTRIASTRCYIEEYENELGQLSARLREKFSGRKVDLGSSTQAARTDFLRFLSSAARNKITAPGYFSREDGSFCILVSGDIDFDAPDEIRFVNNESLSYSLA